MFFVIGSGRSGTHLIGRIIGSHPKVQAYIEDEKFFPLVTQIATGELSKRKIPKLISKYKKEFQKIELPYILEKSHPNIWMVEELMAAFPYSFFVGIYRDVYATVSSMLLHEGVISWFNKLPENQPNPFLGIDQSNVDIYQTLPIESKCALRWLSHKNRLLHLERAFPGRVKVFNYNELLIDQENQLLLLSRFLNIKNEFKPESFNMESLTKWKEHLGAGQIDSIDKILEYMNHG